MADVPTHILVVEDEDDLVAVYRYNLEQAGHRVTVATSGPDALDAVRRQPPDAVLLDVMLPGMDGHQVCAALRREPHTRTLPIIMVTARGEDVDVVRGLGGGADDYVVKPVSPQILLARIGAVLRRHRARPDAAAAGPDSGLRTVAGITLDEDRVRAHAGNREIPLTGAEFRLLQLLVEHPGRVFSRAQIVDRVHGRDHCVTDRSVDVQVSGLRRKLGDHGDRIETVRGMGYRLQG